MPSQIEIQLDRSSLNLAPGEASEVRATLTNAGSVVDAYVLQVAGIDPAWYTLSANEVRLFPGQSSQVVLKLKPQGTQALAGAHGFSLIATSRDNPAVRAVASGMVTLAAVGGAGAISLDLEPKRVRGRKGAYAITLANAGNAALPLVLLATDPEEALSYTFGTSRPASEAQTPQAQGSASGASQPVVMGNRVASANGSIEHELEIPPGAAIVMPMEVTPRKRIWTGRERSFAVTVGTHPPGVEWEVTEAQRVQGELVYKPVFAALAALPLTLRRALAIVVPLAVLALLLFLLFKPNGSNMLAANARATQTAQAAAASAAAQTAQARANAASGNSATQTARALASNASASQTALALATLGSAGSAGSPSVQDFVLVVPTPKAGQGGAPVSDTPNLQYNVSSARDVRVDQSSSSANLPGLETSTLLGYQLVATGTNGVTTDTLTVLLIRPAAINSFTASATSISAGQSTVLKWQVKGAKSLTLDGSAVALTPTGEGSVSVTPGSTHRYILCATNVVGTICTSVKITVQGGSTATTGPATATKTAGIASASATLTPVATPCQVDNYQIGQGTETAIISGTTDIGLNCDNCTTTIDLPFQFRLYDKSFTTAIVGSNGTLGFVANANTITNTALTAQGFNYAIMPQWDDLTTSGAGLGVFTSISGSAPNRIFNLEWRARYPNGGIANFEVRLFENSPLQQFDVVYGRVDDGGKSSTVGVEKTAGNNFTQYEYNSSAIDSGLALSFTLTCGNGGAVDTSGINVPSKNACLLGRITNPIANSTYLADKITVQAGTTVHWANIDNKIHTTTSVNGLWDSGALARNEGFDYTFTTPGTYTYRSTTDSNLSGTVVVVSSCASPTATQTETATQTLVATLLPTGTASETSTSMPTATGTVPTGTATSTSTARPNTATVTVTQAPTTRPPSGGRPTRPPAPPPPPSTPTCQPGSGYSISTSSGATIVAGTTDTGNHCDDCANTITLPFPVQLYDQTFNAATLSSNGNLQFASSDATSNNQCLPTSALNYAIAPYWDDLTTNCSGCGIYTSVTGTAPNRTLNVEWRAQQAGAATPSTVPAQRDAPPTKQKEVAHSPSRVVSDLTIPGSPISVIVRDSGAYGVYRNNVQQFFGGYAEGTYLWVQAPGGAVQVWGPEYVPAGRQPNTYTPISHMLAGDGSASNPYVVTTVLGVGTTGLQLTQRVSYTNGDEYIRNDWSITNTGTTNYPGLRLFHAADLYTAGNDAGYGYYDPATGAIGGYSQDRSLYQIFSPITPASNYEENGYSTIWSDIGDTAGPGTGFRDLYFPDQYFDNGAGLEWQFNVGPRGSATQADFVSFSNRPIIPTSGVNFEVQLHENSANKEFDVTYGQGNGNGDSATVGVQAGTGSSISQLECNTGGIVPGLRLAFVQTSCGTPLTTVTTTPTPSTTTTVTSTPIRTSTATMVPTGTPTSTGTSTATSTLTGTPTLTSTSTDTASPTPTPTQCVIDNYQISQSTGNITPGQNDIGNHCNDCATGLNLPFPVRVYGETYNSLNVSSNGNLQFNSANPNANNSCLPAAGFSTSIFPYWDDLDTSSIGVRGAPGGVIPGVYTSVTGVAPNRIFNIEWRAYAANGAQASKPAATPTVPVKVPQASGTLTVTATPTQCATGGAPWTFVAPLPTQVANNAGAGDSTNFYSVGGFQSDGQPTPSVVGANTYQYNAASNSWNTMAPVPAAGQSMSVVDTGGKVYAFGGNDTDIYRNNTQIFDPATGQWSQGAPMPDARFGTYAGAYNGKIFVAGGKQSLFGFADGRTYEYDIQANSYTTPTTMTRPNSQGAYVTMGQYLYTFGGDSGGKGSNINAEANRLDMSNPGLGWTNVMTMPLALRGASASVVGNKIWIFGGQDSNFNSTFNTFIYDPALDTYTNGPPMNMARSDFAGGNVADRSIAAGGNTPNLMTNTAETSSFIPCPTSTATASPTSTLTNTSTATPTSTSTNTPTPTPSPVYVNFEVQLYENSVTSPAQAFNIIYGSTGTGSGVTVGAQKDAGARIAQYECNTGGLRTGLELTFALPPCGSVTPSTTATASVTVTVTPSRTSTVTPTFTPTATATLPACATTNSSDVPLPVGIFGVVTSTLTIQQPGLINSIRVVNLALDKVTQDTPDNVRATLISPSGSQVVLLDWACGTVPYTGTMSVTLDDGAPTNINTTYCNQNITGSYRPDPGPLSSLNGQQAQGTWQLRIETQASTAQLNSWGLDICYLIGGQQQGTPTATPLLQTPSVTATRAIGIGQRPTSTSTTTPTFTASATAAPTAPPAALTARPARTPTAGVGDAPTRTPATRPTSGIVPAPVGTAPPPLPECSTWASTRSSTLPAAGGIIRSTVNVPRQGAMGSIQVSVDIEKDAPGAIVGGYLVSPSGAQLQLFNWSCGSSLNSRGGARMNATFADSAPRRIDQAYCDANISGTFRPDPDALAALQGADAAGTWTLVLQTSGPAPASGGKLNGWSLQICFANGAAQGTGNGLPVDIASEVVVSSVPQQELLNAERSLPPDG